MADRQTPVTMAVPVNFICIFVLRTDSNSLSPSCPSLWIRACQPITGNKTASLLFAWPSPFPPSLSARPRSLSRCAGWQQCNAATGSCDRKAECMFFASANVRQLRHYFGPSFTRSSALYHTTRAVWDVLLRALAYRMLIGACDPIFCPNWGFRYAVSRLAAESRFVGCTSLSGSISTTL